MIAEADKQMLEEMIAAAAERENEDMKVSSQTDIILRNKTGEMSQKYFTLVQDSTQTMYYSAPRTWGKEGKHKRSEKKTEEKRVFRKTTQCISKNFSDFIC